MALAVVLYILAYVLQSFQPVQLPPQIVQTVRFFVQGFGKELSCPAPNSYTYVIAVSPREVVDYYGLSVENDEIVLKHTNTTEEALSVLSMYLKPEIYYYYYAVLTALVADYPPLIGWGNGSVYELHLLPVSEDDREGLVNKSVYVCAPPRLIVPPVEPRAIANSSIEEVSTFLEVEPGVVLNVTVLKNVVTYAPTANLSVSYGVSHNAYVDVYPEVDVAVSASVVDSDDYSYCHDYDVGNVTYTYCYTYIYYRYNVSYNIRAALYANGTAVDAIEAGGSFEHRAGGRGTMVYAYREGLNYQGFGPFMKAWIEAVDRVDRSGGCRRTNESVYCYYRYTYYTTFTPREERRSLRLWRADLELDARIDKAFTGVLSTMAVEFYNATHVVVGPLDASTSFRTSAWPWEEKSYRLYINLSDVVSICNMFYIPPFTEKKMCIDIPRSTRIANISISFEKPSTDIPWGSKADVYPNISIGIEQAFPKEPDINISAVTRLLSPNPGEVWLQKLVFMYIHDRFRDFVKSNSYTNKFYDAYMWLLATQIPIAMWNSTCHTGVKPLLDALSDGGGCEWEKVSIVKEVLQHSLDVSTRNTSIAWPSLTGPNVSALAAVANISSYPGLWQLYNGSMELLYAKSVDSCYQVCYNIYENSVFCDWRRISLY